MRLHTAALISVYVMAVKHTHTHTRDLSSFETLLSAEWNFLTDVSGQPIGPHLQRSRTLLGLFYLEAGADKLSRNVGKKCYSTLSKIPKERRSPLHCGGSLKVSCPSLVRKKCSKYRTELKSCIVILCCQAFQARFRKHSLEGERVRVTYQVCTPTTLALTASESKCSHHRLCENRTDYKSWKQSSNIFFGTELSRLKWNF